MKIFVAWLIAFPGKSDRRTAAPTGMHSPCGSGGAAIRLAREEALAGNIHLKSNQTFWYS
jgi:hypothetical protein